MNDKIKDMGKISENEEVSTEDLEDVSGGRAYITHDGYFVRPNRPFVRPVIEYGGPRPKLRPLTPEDLKKLEERKKKKEREEKIEQMLKLAREIDE